MTDWRSTLSATLLALSGALAGCSTTGVDDDWWAVDNRGLTTTDRWLDGEEITQVTFDHREVPAALSEVRFGRHYYRREGGKWTRTRRPWCATHAAWKDIDLRDAEKTAGFALREFVQWANGVPDGWVWMKADRRSGWIDPAYLWDDPAPWLRYERNVAEPKPPAGPWVEDRSFDPPERSK